SSGGPVAHGRARKTRRHQQSLCLFIERYAARSAEAGVVGLLRDADREAEAAKSVSNDHSFVLGGRGSAGQRDNEGCAAETAGVREEPAARVQDGNRRRRGIADRRIPRSVGRAGNLGGRDLPHAGLPVQERRQTNYRFRGGALRRGGSVGGAVADG